ncbi:RNA chaperone ProQ [Orbaceae bacterium ESL0721]|nr:RNA chaperone ProQ [Orbaceae bacterium ESL0721]
MNKSGTSELQQMENQFQLTNNREIITYLVKQFPNCFSLEGSAKPLKIGIFQDILSRLDDNTALSKTRLRTALRAYTSSWRYLYSIKEGIHRVDLDGNPNEVVTQTHLEHAQQQLKESKEKAKKYAAEKRKNLAKSSKTSSNEILPKKSPVIPVIGDLVKVVIGGKPITVQVVNIEKDHLKVKANTGMEMTVKIDHILSPKKSINKKSR